jgi:hypothetical protein
MIFGRPDDEDFDETENEQTRKYEGPDYARGERTMPGDADRTGSDFAQGERTTNEDLDRSGPDYARGERTMNEDVDRQGPDYARGERTTGYGSKDFSANPATPAEPGFTNPTFTGDDAVNDMDVDRGDVTYTEYEVVEIEDEPGMGMTEGYHESDLDRTSDLRPGESYDAPHAMHSGEHMREMGRPAPEHGDFARGERHEPDFGDRQGPDFARGERHENDEADIQGPDFARGERTDASLEDVEGPDFARGQREFPDDAPDTPDHLGNTNEEEL